MRAMFFLFAVLIACATASGPLLAQQGGPRPVGVITLKSQAVPFVLTVPGRAVAYQSSEIRPQVTGVIDEVVYAQGAPVAAGDVMFRIDSETFAAEARAAKAAVAQAEAALSTAQNTLSRYERLRELATSQAQIEDAQVAVLTAEAALQQARAQHELAELQLARTEVKSPINGIPSVPAISVGAIVTANQPTALATVTRLDPIYVDLTDSSAHVLRVQELIRSGEIETESGLEFTLTLETGATYDQPGRLVSQGADVSQTTGAMAFRVEFPNPDGVIRPGQFLRADVKIGERMAYLVPQRAAQRTAQGVLSFYVVRDGKAQQIETSALGSYENAWIVAEGPEDGDQLIVDGLARLRSGDAVAPMPVELDADGRIVPAGN